jgi:hypothetical protein
MKRIAAVLAGVVALALSACVSTGTQTQTPAQVLANVHTQAVKLCAIATPTLASLEAMKPQMTPVMAADLDKASPIVASACSASAAPVASVQDLVNVAVPAAIKIIAASPMKDADKTAVEIALTAASVGVSAALAQYAPAVAVPASAASGV